MPHSLTQIVSTLVSAALPDYALHGRLWGRDILDGLHSLSLVDRLILSWKRGGASWWGMWPEGRANDGGVTGFEGSS